MSNRTLNLSDGLYDYILAHSVKETPLQMRLRAATAQLAEADMQISPEQGQFMFLLARLMGVATIVEVGTFTGYSALCLAPALPDSGRMICCDVSEQWTDIAKPYWLEAGIEGRIDLRLAPAVDTLNELLATGFAGQVDLMFIDADKESYRDYYEKGLELLRPGGLMMVDNTLWGGSVIDPENQQSSTVAIREFNDYICRDKRILLSLLPISDGLSLCLKL